MLLTGAPGTRHHTTAYVFVRRSVVKKLEKKLENVIQINVIYNETIFSYNFTFMNDKWRDYLYTVYICIAT